MPTQMDPTPIAAPIAAAHSTDNSGKGGVVDPTGSLENIFSALGTNASAVVFDETPQMMVSEAEAEAAGLPVLEGTETPAAAAPTPAAAAPAVAPDAAPAALPTAEERKAYIAATSKAAKAEREAAQKLARAEAAERRATELAAQAQAFQAASADWQKDPTAIIRAAGLSEPEYYQRLAEHALSAADAPPPDPVAVEVQRQMAPLLKAKAEADEREAQHQQAMAQTRGIVDKVLPVITQGAEKYETLIALHGGDASKAAVYVYQKMKERFDHDGVFIEPAAAAEELEELHYQQQLEGLKAARALKKFSTEFGVPVAAAPPAPAAPPPPAPKPPPSPTLTAASGPKVTPLSPVRSGNKILSQRNTARTGDRDLDEVMSKFGIA